MNLQELLSDLKISVKESSQHKNIRYGWIGMDCPWCGKGSGKFHLGINLKTYQTTCWQCGGHSLSSVLSELGGISYKEAYRQMELLDRKPLRWDPKTTSGNYQPPDRVEGLLEAHRRYLRARGFDPDSLAKTWGIGGLGYAGGLRWRIFIPISYRSRYVSWTTRSVGDSGAKYISAKPTEEAISHKSLLYGSDLANGSVVVTEGPVDAWKIGPGAVATFGVKVTPEQVLRISRFPNRAICFDSERAAQRKAEHLAALLDSFPGKTSVIELDAPDPGSASRKEVRLLRKAVFGER